MHYTKQDIINELAFSAKSIIEALNKSDDVTIKQNAKHIERIAQLLKEDYDVDYLGEKTPTTWSESIDELNNIMN